MAFFDFAEVEVSSSEIGYGAEGMGIFGDKVLAKSVDCPFACHLGHVSLPS